MSNLGQLMGQIASQMNQSMRATQGAAPGGSAKAPNEAEQKAYTKLLDSALKEGNKERILTLQDGARRAGVPIAPYLEAMGDESPEQQISNFTNQLILENLGLAEPADPSPFGDSDVAYDVPESAQQPKRPTGPAAQKLEEMFTPEFVARAVAKKQAGIDIGEHSLTDKSWFEDFAQMPDSMTATERKEVLASKWGYIPAQAAQLKDLSLDERKSITEGLIVRHMQDEALSKTINQYFPKADHDKTKMGFILNKLAQDGYPIPDRHKTFLDRFTGLHDDFAQFDAEKIARETKVKGFAKEQVEQRIFDDKLQREVKKAKELREVNKPRLSEGAITKIQAGKDFLDLSQRTTDVITGFTGIGKDLNLDKLPVGPVDEIFQKRMDKYGIKADEERIKLRTATLKLVELMYQIRGKQLSDKEAALALQLQASMNESPIQFVTKFSEFQRSLIDSTRNAINIRKEAGYDVGELEALEGTLRDTPILEDMLKTQESAESPQFKSELLESLGKFPNGVKDEQGNFWKLGADGKPIQIQRGK